MGQGFMGEIWLNISCIKDGCLRNFGDMIKCKISVMVRASMKKQFGGEYYATAGKYCYARI